MTSPPMTMPAPRKNRHLLAKILVAVVLIVVVGFALWAWSTLGYAYSSGERTGTVQKLSHKGWLCKTWEGELAMSPVVGAQPQMFDFTIRSDSLARALELASGKQVSLNYAQHKGVPSSCFGETEYYIESFRVTGAR